MSILPDFLINAYESLCDTEIVKNKVINKDTIDIFVSHLNQSIPKKYTPEYTIYLFNRTKYKVNRARFIKDIHGSPYKSMILWTNYREILKHFDLIQKFYLKWDKELNHYSGDVYDPSKGIKKILSHEEESKEDLDEKKEIEPETKSEEITQEKIEEYMDDQDRLLEYMQQRKKEMLENEAQTTSTS